MNRNWTLFLDRDGVINEKIAGYVTSWDNFIFCPWVFTQGQKINDYFSHIFIVTNQQGIGKGLMSEYDLGIIHGRMIAVLSRLGLYIDDIFYCPHLESEKCACRKPAPGMAAAAKQRYPRIDFKKSIMVGDSQSDKEFAENAGMLFLSSVIELLQYIDLYGEGGKNDSK